MSYDLVTGDTLPTLYVAVKDLSGAAYDLTGHTAVFRWDDGGTIIEKAASVANNVASYQFAAGEIFAPKMRIELEITNAAGKIITAPSLIELSVREQLG